MVFSKILTFLLLKVVLVKSTEVPGELRPPPVQRGQLGPGRGRGVFWAVTRIYISVEQSV